MEAKLEEVEEENSKLKLQLSHKEKAHQGRIQHFVVFV